MKCKRCGALLKNDGDLCTKCYKDLKKEQELNDDTKEVLKVKKKYSPKYALIVKLIDWYIIFGILIVVCFMSKNFFTSILFIAILLIIMFCTLVLCKKSASQTYIVFFNKKVVFKRKFLFINIERTLAYEDIKDIVFTQGTSWFTRTFQKMFNFGNIYVYPKKGNILTSGMQLEVVEKIDKVMADIKTVVGDKIK